jgi:DNA modification methylase
MEFRILEGDCLDVLRTLPDASVHCCVTSPPYWGLRDYGHDGQIGLESTPEAYVARMVEVFREVRRVLRDDGTLWLNLGDSYKGGKQLGGIPWRVAFALQADGWWLRQDIIWHKPNPMPESVRDRCTKAHEYVFLLTKGNRYYYESAAVSEPAKTAGQIGGLTSYAAVASGRKPSGNMIPERGAAYVRPATRNRRSVWTISTKSYSGAHFAVMPPELVEPCIKAGCPEQCCPVCGAGYERKREKTGKVLSTGGSENNRRNGHTDFGGSDMNCGTFVQHEWKTLGWKPACDCVAAGTIPGTVLDPFAGSGTVAAVALSLGRSSIGIELNPQYVELAQERIAKTISSQPLIYNLEGE